MEFLKSLFSVSINDSHLHICIMGIKLKLRLGQKIPYTKCYSQLGEDIILMSYYNDCPDYKGFYLDIGAHHPYRYSNTQLFYEKGWSGINIDATPGSMVPFEKARPRDINLELAISDKSEELVYLCFDDPALNCIATKETEALAPELKTKIKQRVKLKAKTVNEVLDENLPENTHIDFINIDVEGLELKILQMLDFKKYAPDYFLIEELEYDKIDFKEHINSPIAAFLREKGYIVAAKTRITILYKKVSKN